MHLSLVSDDITEKTVYNQFSDLGLIDNEMFLEYYLKILFVLKFNMRSYTCNYVKNQWFLFLNLAIYNVLLSTLNII